MRGDPIKHTQEHPRACLRLDPSILGCWRRFRLATNRMGFGGSKLAPHFTLTSSISTGFELEVRSAVIRLQCRLLATGLVLETDRKRARKQREAQLVLQEAIKRVIQEVWHPGPEATNQPKGNSLLLLTFP